MNLKALRESKGLTQDELADMAGVTQATVSRIEGNNDSVTLKKLKQLAKALDVPVHWILQDDLGEGEINLLRHYRSQSPEYRRGWQAAAAQAIDPAQTEEQ